MAEQDNIDYNLNKIGEIGTSAATEGNYPLGWAQAANTPFKYWKQDANSEGGTHNPRMSTGQKESRTKVEFAPSTGTSSTCFRQHSI